MTNPTVKVTIDDSTIHVPSGSTVLEAASKCEVFIPTLCYHQRLEPYGACRICQVELIPSGKDAGKLVAACTHPIGDGDMVRTDTKEVIEARRFILRLLLARAPQAKAVKTLAEKYEVEISENSEEPFQAYLGAKTSRRLEEAGPEGLTRCMLCGLCTRVCRQVVRRQGISEAGRGPKRRVRPPFNDISPSCIGCGSCAYICPNDAIEIERVED